MMENEHGRIDLLTQEQIAWCDKHISDYDGNDWFVKDDKKIYVLNYNIEFKNKRTIDLFPVKFGNCDVFSCSECSKLKNLEGCPDEVYEAFYCRDCHSLISLKGITMIISDYILVSNCKNLENIDDLKKMNLKGDFFLDNCPKLKKYDSILGDMNVFKRWQMTDLTADEFLKEYDGFLQAQKYGI